MELVKRLEGYALSVAWITVLAVLLVSIYGWIRNYPGYDDTDDIYNGVRSGMVLHTDYKSGCQYLSTRTLFTSSTLTPRVDVRGKHMCTAERGRKN